MQTQDIENKAVASKILASKDLMVLKRDLSSLRLVARGLDCATAALSFAEVVVRDPALRH